MRRQNRASAQFIIWWRNEKPDRCSDETQAQAGVVMALYYQTLEYPASQDVSCSWTTEIVQHVL